MSKASTAPFLSSLVDPQIRFSKAQKEEEGFAMVNGARILEHLINSFNGRCNPYRIFSNDELRTATNNYSQTKILHNGLTYTLYQGSHEGREISVKKFRATSSIPDDDYVAWYVNEVAVASQLSKHKNVLKFLGCCLETQLPTLVYEFAGNGNLHDHMFGHLCRLSWDSRLRIATEIAEAVAYLHEGVSKSIIHREIMSRNIFLDHDFVAKLFEFGLCLPVPLGEKHVDAQVVGNVGFIAPESHATGRFTDKSEVYSFGAVLFEIFTGKKAWNILHECDELGLGVAEEDCSSAIRTGSMLRARNCSWEEIEKKVVESVLRKPMTTMCDQGNDKQQMECAELTRRCLILNPEDRPTIKEVAKALKHIKSLLH